jgi:hypothetical protein
LEVAPGEAMAHPSYPLQDEAQAASARTTRSLPDRGIIAKSVRSSPAEYSVPLRTHLGGRAPQSQLAIEQHAGLYALDLPLGAGQPATEGKWHRDASVLLSRQAWRSVLYMP